MVFLVTVTKYLTEVTCEVFGDSVMVAVVKGTGSKGLKSCSLGSTIPRVPTVAWEDMVGLQRPIPRWCPSLCIHSGHSRDDLGLGLTGLIFEPSSSLADTGSHASCQV